MSNEMREKLEDIIEQVRSSAIRERSPEYLDMDLARDYLIGYCVENSRLLEERIREDTEWNVRVIEGAVDYEVEPTPQSYEEAQKTGTLHHWVEVSDGKETFYCNLIREGENIYHEPLVSRDVPDEYIIFD